MAGAGISSISVQNICFVMKEDLKETPAIAQKDVSRRQFLSYAGLAGAGLVIASCNNDDDDQPEPDGTVDLGSEDFGLLNYMFALKQLSAAFYTRFTTPFYPDAPTAETEFVPDIRDHEIAHRELLRNMLGDRAIIDFEFVLQNSIDFNNRPAVLAAAKDIEQKMISGFLGIANRFASAQYFEQIAKMTTVDGRHIAYISDVISYNSFALDVNTDRKDSPMTPEEVIAALSNYFPNTISAKRLPK
jgi:hypothetical protein